MRIFFPTVQDLLILDQLAYSLPKTNTTFHELSENDKNDTICSLIAGVIN